MNFIPQGNNRESEEEGEIRERLRLGNGVISSVEEQIRKPKPHNEPPQGLDNIFDVKLSGKLKGEGIEVTFNDTSLTSLTGLSTRGRVKRIKETLGTVLATGGTGKDAGSAMVVGSGFGSGRSLYLAFDLGESAVAGDEEGYREFIGDIIDYVRPEEAVAAVPLGVEYYEARVESLVVPLQVDVESFVAAPLVIELVLDGGERTGSTVNWNFLLGLEGEKVLRMLLSLPEGPGENEVETRVSYLVRGGYREFETKRDEVVVGAASGEVLDDVIGLLEGMDPPNQGGQKSRVEDAIEELGELRRDPPRDKEAAASAIETIVEVLEDLDRVDDVPESVVPSLGILLRYYERLWSGF